MRCDTANRWPLGKAEGKIMKDEVKAKLDSACRGLSLSR
jgi:hypothetical protein